VPGAEPIGLGCVGVVLAVAAAKEAPVEQRGHHSDAEPAGEVVVAGPGAAQRVRAGALPQRADRFGWRDPGDRLQHVGDGRARQTEVAGAALPLGGEQVGLEEPGEVLADGGGRDPSLAGEHAGRQRPTVGQCHQHPCAGPVADQSGDAGDIRVARRPRYSAHVGHRTSWTLRCGPKENGPTMTG